MKCLYHHTSLDDLPPVGQCFTDVVTGIARCDHTVDHLNSSGPGHLSKGRILTGKGNKGFIGV